MLEELRRRLQSPEFVPFYVRTSDGREYFVPSRDHAWAPAHGTRVHVLNDDGTTDFIAGYQIASLHEPREAVPTTN